MTKRQTKMNAPAPAKPRAATRQQLGKAPARSPLIDRLVAWRKSQSLTQKETAARLEINFDTYKAYECGHRNPSGTNTIKILGLIGALK
jgi:DNA-binding transcriptional regulator YiaG